jgi:hypothetical protein
LVGKPQMSVSKSHHSRVIIFVGGKTVISRKEFFLREACSGQEHFENPKVADRVLIETKGNTPLGAAVERALALSGNMGRGDPADRNCKTLAVYYFAFSSLFFLSCATFWSLQLTARPSQGQKSTKDRELTPGPDYRRVIHATLAQGVSFKLLPLLPNSKPTQNKPSASG